MSPRSTYTVLMVVALALLMVPAVASIVAVNEKGAVQGLFQFAMVAALLTTLVGTFTTWQRVFLLGSGMVTVLSVVGLASRQGLGVLALQLAFLSLLLGSLMGAMLLRHARYVADDAVWPNVDDLVSSGLRRAALDTGLRVGAAGLLGMLLVALSLPMAMGSASLLLVAALALVAVLSLFVAMKLLGRSES